MREFLYATRHDLQADLLPTDMSSTTPIPDSPLPGLVRFEEDPNHFRCLVIEGPQAEARIYLHGAHVAHYQPRTGARDRPVLFMSQKSWFDPQKPIRGGVPVIFPWFGACKDIPNMPNHGLARIREWTLESATPTPEGGVAITLCLEPDAAFRAAWPSGFLLRYRVVVGTSLAMTLEVTNCSLKPMRFEEALHTYFAVSDIRNVTVEGLHGRYIDTVGGHNIAREHGAGPIRFESETDRIYLDNRAPNTIHDPGWKRRILVEKSGSDTTVLWNPWEAKARIMPDFMDDEWPSMLCIETCNVADHAVILPPDQTHRMQAVIRAEEE
jgi:glucose-6-phosphate 1-epimerase